MTLFLSTQNLSVIHFGAILAFHTKNEKKTYVGDKDTGRKSHPTGHWRGGGTSRRFPNCAHKKNYGCTNLSKSYSFILNVFAYPNNQ